MNGHTKVYIVNANGLQFYVRECAAFEPLLLLEYGPHIHLYHKNGFKFDNILRGNLGEAFSNEVYAAFDKCQKYLEANPRPWEKDSSIEHYKEYWDAKIKPFTN